MIDLLTHPIGSLCFFHTVSLDHTYSRIPDARSAARQAAGTRRATREVGAGRSDDHPAEGAIVKVECRRVGRTADADARSEVAAHLARVPMFSELDDEQRGYLVDQMQARTYEPGEPIFVQGTMGDELHVVLEGTVALTGRDAGGGATVVSTLGPGASFGEIGFLAHQPRTLSAVNGPQPGLHLVLPRADFDRVATLTPDIGLGVFERVLALITERMQVLSEGERNYLMWGYGHAPAPSARPVARRAPVIAGAIAAALGGAALGWSSTGGAGSLPDRVATTAICAIATVVLAAALHWAVRSPETTSTPA
jgi:CRP-like cAMP-binding protein